MNPRHLILALVVSLFTGACGKKSDPLPEPFGNATASEVAFKAGTGLTLPPEIRTAIGLKTAPSDDRVVVGTLRVNAPVLKAGPPTLVNVTLTAAETAGLAAQPLAGARLMSHQPHGPAPDSPVDLVFALDDRPDAKPGDFLALSLTLTAAPPGATIPRSALLRSASGTFVYVVNGGAYLRTAVVPGAESATHIAIADGLYAGDEVVTHPVEQLWLMELHLTLGGGHCH